MTTLTSATWRRPRLARQASPLGVLSSESQAHMAERGETTARAAQVATYATRKPKERTVEAEGLLPEWRERARSLGLDDETLAGLVDRVAGIEVPEPGTGAAEELFAALAAPDGLTPQASTFGRKEVLQAICDRLPVGADIGQVVALAKEFVASDHVVAIGVPERFWTSDVLRRLDGTVVAAHLDLLRWCRSRGLGGLRPSGRRRSALRPSRGGAAERLGYPFHHHCQAARRPRPSRRLRPPSPLRAGGRRGGHGRDPLARPAP